MLKEVDEGLTSSSVTMVKETIHNPNEVRHFMKLKQCSRLVRVWFGDTLLAETENAVRVLEAGYDFYDPVFYFKSSDLEVQLHRIHEKFSHCPLKGEASYFAFDASDTEPYLAWSYEETFDFASELNGLIAFNPAKVRIEEVGAEA